MASRASAGIGARCGHDTWQQSTPWEFLASMCHRHTWSTEVIEVTNATDANAKPIRPEATPEPALC